MTLNEITIEAEELGQVLLKTVGKISAIRGYKIARNELKNLGGGLKLGSRMAMQQFVENL